MKIKTGIHTFSLTTKSSYSEIQNIRQSYPNMVVKQDACALNVALRITAFQEQGIEILMHQSLSRTSWITVIINPSSLLEGEYCPTELYQASKKTMQKIRKRITAVFHEIGLERKSKDLSLSRADLTINRYCASKTELLALLDIFRKSYYNRHYRVVPFGGKDGFAEKYRGANHHSWTIQSGSCALSVYDKTYELSKRHGIKIQDQILRVELRLERKRIKRLVARTVWEEQLLGVYEQHAEIIQKFLHRLHQDFPMIVTKEAAIQMVDKSGFQKRTKAKMKTLIKKTDGCESLTAAKKKMKISDQKFIELLKRFKKLGISPITLKNGAKIEKLYFPQDIP